MAGKEAGQILVGKKAGTILAGKIVRLNGNGGHFVCLHGNDGHFVRLNGDGCHFVCLHSNCGYACCLAPRPVSYMFYICFIWGWAFGPPYGSTMVMSG